MTRDFFDHLTDPNASTPPRALDPQAAELQQRLGKAVHFLRDHGPENGIDLVPVWERIVAEENHTLASPAPTQAAVPERLTVEKPSDFSIFPAWLRYAAVLVIGLGIGAATTGARQDANGRLEADAHYTAKQRDLMFDVLQTDQLASASTLRMAAVDLAGCLACHDASLGKRLSSLETP